MPGVKSSSQEQVCSRDDRSRDHSRDHIALTAKGVYGNRFPERSLSTGWVFGLGQ